MKISLNWINDYISVDLKPEDFAHRLTMAGLEVESIENVKGDTVFEIEVTPNRADCLNMLGMAREASAILNKSMKLPKIKLPEAPKANCDITIEDKEKCARYIGVLIKDVNVGQSDKFIGQRVESLGLRPVNNIVDITNFCLMEYGQPLHAFDYDKLEGGKIIVRPARKGEKIVTIDGETYELDPSVLVIADEKKPVAIAGIMGGQETEVTGSTKNVLLESAYFDPILIRRTSRKLGLSSDSSYRFERGVDFENVKEGTKRAVSLILDMAKGEMVAHTDNVARKIKSSSKKIGISQKAIHSSIGADIPLSKVQTILKKLGCEVSELKNDELSILPPTFRVDLKASVDLVEEIARVIGYDNLPSRMPVIKAYNVLSNEKLIDRSKIRQTIIGQGFNEVITYSMVGEKDLELTQMQDIENVKLKNPLSLDYSIMRPSLLPSFLSVIQTNLNRGQKNLSLFEMGKHYLKAGEKEVLALAVTGVKEWDWRSGKLKNVDFFDLKGSVEEVLNALRVTNVKFQAASLKWAAEGETAEIILDGKAVGSVYRVEEDVLRAGGIKQKDVFFAEIMLEDLYGKTGKDRRYKAPSEYPDVSRDISLAVAENVTFEDIKRLAKENGGAFLSDIQLIEEYLGEKIEKGKRGLVVSFCFQSNERTLREDEVNADFEKISESIIKEFKAVKR